MLLDGLGWSHYSVFTLYYDSNPRSRTVWGGKKNFCLCGDYAIINGIFLRQVPVVPLSSLVQRAGRSFG